MKQKFIDYFCKVADLTANLSHGEKLKVGAVLVRDNRILLTGYNGTPSGESNVLEDVLENGELKTKNSVSHAEENIILYAARCGISTIDSELFITHSPCHVCARLIKGSGIKTIYYKNEYRDSSGIEFLRELGINVIKI